MTCNVYDFDKTILQKDSSVEFYKFCLKKKPSIIKYIFEQIFFFVLYVFSFIDKTKFKSHMFAFLKSFKDIDAVVEEFWKEKEKYINDWYYQKHQPTDIIISASPMFLLAPICKKLGVGTLIASDVDPKTGKFNSPNCYGEEKVNRLNAYSKDIEINEFYSDSKSDQPLADLAKQAYLVKHGELVKWDEYKPTLKERIKKRFFSKEFLAFLVVGGINTINGVWISYVFSLFLDPVLSFVIGYLISLSISYFLNSLLVFKSKLHIVKYFKFCISYIPNFLIQNCLILLFYYQLHFDKLLVYILAAIIAIPVTFLILSLFTFAKKKEEGSENAISIPSYCFGAASLIVTTIAIDILLCSALFIAKIGISWFQLPLSFIITSIVYYFVKGKKNTPTFILEVVSTLIIFVMAILVAGMLFDHSYDGNSYHKLAVGFMKYGWNPFYEIPNADVFERILGSRVEVATWVDGYTKGTWIFASSVYSITNNIEAGKCYNLLLLVALLLASYGAFKKKINNEFVAVGLALAATMNPVLISQLFTFYIDGALYAGLYLLVLYLFMWQLDSKESRIYQFLLIGGAMVICGNIKFTGLLYGAVFCIVNFLYFSIKSFVSNKDNLSKKDIFKKLLKPLLGFMCVAIVTICWAGSNSYVTNIIRHHNIGYPLIGEGAIDIMTPNSPFEPGSNSLVNLFKSLFAKAGNFAYTSGKRVELKIPFTFDINQLNVTFESCDQRLAGFGLFFSGIILFVVALFIYEIIKSKKNNESLLLLVNFIVCAIFTVVIKESWWARYAPYIYMMALMVLYNSLTNENKDVKQMHILGLITLVIVIINGTFTCSTIGMNIIYSQTVAADLQAAKEIGKDIYALNTPFAGWYFNLLDNGFNFIIDEDIFSKIGFRFIASTSTAVAPR